jgi:gamma-glutamylcyclotransferase (GGCT)/AIG2-like uncharacterized protein YtfP
VFVYGTLRPGSWNHARWLAPFLAGPCRPARVTGHVLHHLDGLPYVVPGDGVVVGDLADLDPAREDEAMANLDELEGVDVGHLERATATLDDGQRALLYVAGPLVLDRLGPATLVEHGDWLRLEGPASA